MDERNRLGVEDRSGGHVKTTQYNRRESGFGNKPTLGTQEPAQTVNIRELAQQIIETARANNRAFQIWQREFGLAFNRIIITDPRTMKLSREVQQCIYLQGARLAADEASSAVARMASGYYSAINSGFCPYTEQQKSDARRGVGWADFSPVC